MTTLTEASIISRKGIRYFIYSIIIFIILRGIILTGIVIYKKVFPPPPVPPTVSFGKLTTLPFPEKQKPVLNFSLETAEGGLPQFPDQLKVFFMPKQPSNLLSLDFAQDRANRLGFNIEAQQLTESLYKFYHKTSPSTMETNIITGSFSLSYDLNVDPSPISVKPPLPEIARNSIKSLLSGANLYPDDLEGGRFEHNYLKTESGDFIPANSLSDANIIRVDLFRKNYDNLPTVTQTTGKGNVWFMVSGVKERGKEVVAGEYHYFPVDETQMATYPIKTADIVWQEFSSGNYYPASLGTTAEGESIKIRKVYLAYYDAGMYTEFLQPVFVFEGDKNFVGYIPAVVTDYYGE
ncbi:MAG: hypothetical protein Q8Q30_01220 [Candidatus Woesebacteria bacterium]|nr:hypothetical protein [Candidatus Woesebacteria bacterium]